MLNEKIKNLEEENQALKLQNNKYEEEIYTVKNIYNERLKIIEYTPNAMGYIFENRVKNIQNIIK